jgi:hypothetical protein
MAEVLIAGSSTVACGALTVYGPRIFPSGVRWQLAQVSPAASFSFGRAFGFGISGDSMGGIAKASGKWQTLHDLPSSSTSRACIGYPSTPAKAWAVALVATSDGKPRSSPFADL